MKRLWVIFLFICQQTYAQQRARLPVDTLVNKLSVARDDSNKLVLLRNIARYYENVDINKSFAYRNQGLKLAGTLKNFQYTCIFYDLFAEALINKADFKGALKKLDTAYAIAANHNEKLSMAFTCGDYGLAYQILGNYIKAQDYFFKCLSIAEQLKDYKLAVGAAINVGTIYGNQENDAKAIAYAKRVLQMVKQYHLHGLAGETKAYELLGTMYLNEKKYREGAANYKLALAIYSHDKNEMGEAICYSGLATVYPDDYAKTLTYGLKAKAMWDKLSASNIYAIDNLGNLGIAYGDLVRFNQWQKIRDSIPLNIRRKIYLRKAQTYLSKAIQMARDTHTQYNVMMFTDSLAKLQSYLGNYKAAFENIEQHNLLSDSIFSQNNKNKIAGIEEQHEVSLRDKQLEINKLQLANQHKQTLILAGSLVLMLCIAGLIYLESRNRKRLNAKLSAINSKLDEANKLKTKFFSILNHDLKRPVASFVTFRRLQKTDPLLLSEATREQYEERITASAENLLSTMEDLLLWSKGQMENFKPELRNISVSDLFNYIAMLFESSNVTFTFILPHLMVLVTDEHYFKTIMQNLTNNAIHALADTLNPAIEWKAWESNDKKYLSITDNGPGTTEEKLKALYDDTITIGIQNGLGLHIVRDLASAIGCKITIMPKEANGLCIQLSFS